MHCFKNLIHFANLIYRDRNSTFVKDKKTGKWYGTPHNLFYEATHYVAPRKIPLNVADFFGIFMKLLKEVTVM